jgi:hypothetical protein
MSTQGIFDGPNALDGSRSYEPGYRPWEAFQGLGTVTLVPTRPTVRVPVMQSDSMAVPLLIGGIAAVALVGVAAYAYMGYYVGKQLGTKWGWFWGGFGPAGLAAMQWYRESQGRVATPNRRRRRRHHRRSKR